jgi:hypothetical protein
VTKENLILVAKISKESSDANQKPPVDLLKREKVCVDVIELVLFRLSRTKTIQKADCLLLT